VLYQVQQEGSFKFTPQKNLLLDAEGREQTMNLKVTLVTTIK